LKALNDRRGATADPISKTCYLSHYAAMKAVKAVKTPQDFARKEALAILRLRRRAWDETNELPLF
jgi:tRNA threonylcarbamoyladenosine modification (KEOPS) complex Cgi121 subunit